MTLAESAPLALAVTAAFAVVARLARAVTNSGAGAGLLVGGLVSAGFGLAGLGVLGAFFLLGSVATKLGWGRKTERGTAEAGGGARDAARVAGKGGMAAVVGLAAVLGLAWPGALTGCLAAALADTLGTEIGSLYAATPRTVPTFRAVPAGTPGAVSLPGTVAGLVGATLVACTAAGGELVPWHAVVWLGVAGLAAALLESAAAGVVPAFKCLPGWSRNLLTTGSGAAFGWLAVQGSA